MRGNAVADGAVAAPACRRPSTPGHGWPGVFVLGCALAAGAPPVAAQVMATGEYLARMDADGDGRISLVEYQDWMSYAFDAMDRDECTPVGHRAAVEGPASSRPWQGNIPDGDRIA